MGHGTCPTAEQLAAFQLGELDESELEAIGQHLESCARCEESARRLDAIFDPTLASLRRLGEPTPAGSPAPAMTDLAAVTIDGPAGDHPATVSSPTDRPGTEASPAPFPRGRRIGGYEVLDELGRGGMGVVYRAYQTRLYRIVALKMMLASRYGDPRLRDRFRREAESIAGLRHPNIVQIFDIGEEPDEDGQPTPFMALEYVAAGSLDDRTRGEPQRPNLVAEWVETIARAIHYAHVHGIVHRDLKPGNVLVDDDGRLKITDFGLAKRLASSDERTRTGLVLGTPEYMAPEQAAGRGTGPPVDIYAMGAILYKLLTGRPPFQGASVLETLQQLRDVEPIPPGRLLPKLPRDLETICLKCLEKQPARRYATAGQLAEDLRRFLAGETLLARRPSHAERIFRWARRNRLVAGLAGAFLVALLAGTTISTLLAIVSRREADRAVAAEGEALRSENRAVVARRASQRLLGEVLLDKGIAIARRGEVAEGILWMLRGLEETSEADPAFAQVVRTNLAAWLPLTAGLRAVVEDEERLRVCAFSPDGTSFVTGSMANTVRHYDTASLQPIGVPILSDGRFLTFVGFSHDGKTLLIAVQPHGSNPAQLRRFDAVTHQPVGEPLLHPSAPSGVANSPDGGTIATAAGDQLVRFWELSTGRPCRSPLVHPEGTRVGSVAWSPDGRCILVGSWRGIKGTEAAAAYIWDLGTNEPEPRLVLRHESGVIQVAFAPAGKSVLTLDADHTVRLWDATSGRPLGTPMIHPDGVDSARFSPDGSIVVTACEDGIAQSWDAATGHPLVGSILAAAPGAGDLALHPDGKTMLVVSVDRKGNGSGWLWDFPRAPGRSPERMAEVLSKGSVISDARANHRRQITVAYSANREIALVATDPALARLRDTVDGQPVGRPMWHRFAAVGATSYSPVGNVVATSFLDGSIASTARIWDAATGRPVGPPLRHVNWVLALRFSPDGKTLATSDFVHARIHFWDTATGRRLGAPLEQKGQVVDLAFSPDGQTLAVALAASKDRPNLTTLWHVASRTSFGEDINGYESALRFSPDGSALIACHYRTYRLHDSASGRPLGPALIEDSEILTCDFSPDSKRVVFGFVDGVLRVVDPVSGQQSGSLMFHTSPVQAVAFSPDSEGRLLAAACADGTAWLWDRASSRPLGPPFVHGKDLAGVAFRPDGQTLVTVASDGSTVSWPVPAPLDGSPERIALALERRTALELSADRDLRRLTAAEWKGKGARLETLEGTDERAYAGSLTDQAWHQTRAREAEREGNDHELFWHLDRLAAANGTAGSGSPSESWLVSARRARGHSRAGRLDLADVEYRRAAASAPPERLREWYLHRLADCRIGRNWETLLWYADRADATGAADVDIHLARATAYLDRGEWARCVAAAEAAAQIGAEADILFCIARDLGKQRRWREAATVCALAVPRAEVSIPLWSTAAVILLESGESERYRSFCTQALADEQMKFSRIAAVQAAWLCALAPISRSDTEAALRLLEGLSNRPLSPELAHFVFASEGALLYRAGRYKEALERLKAAIDADHVANNPEDWVFQAMAHYRLGHINEAHDCLVRVPRARLRTGAELDWDDVQTDVLRREAEALIELDRRFPGDPFAR